MELPLAPSGADAALFGPRLAELFRELLHEKHWLARRPVDPVIRSPFDNKECYELVNGVWEQEFLAKHSNTSGSRSAAAVSTDRGPAACFSIRSASSKVFSVIDSMTGASIDETEQRRAMFDLIRRSDLQQSKGGNTK